MFILFDILCFIFLILYVPHLVLKRKWHRRFTTRFGLYRSSEVKAFKEKENIWIHAVSVGEIISVLDIIAQLQKQYPHYRIVCSTVTKTGYRLAQEKLASNCLVIYAPFDFSFVVHHMISIIRPKLYIATETEIWPNLFLALFKRGIPAILINGRISDKSFKGYKRARYLTKTVLQCMKKFCMQSPEDVKRIIHLGADQGKVEMAGNVKFDQLPSKDIVRERVGFEEKAELLIAGSTHPGEEKIMIETYRSLLAECPLLRLIIAPRHVERTEDVVSIVKSEGFSPVRLSEISSRYLTKDDIVVVDAIGHLRNLYAQSSLVFIGKTFTVGGGQNMIEPLSFGVPTFVGPRTENFTDVMRIFLQEGVIEQVLTPEELVVKMKEVLRQPVTMRTKARNGQKVIEQNRGATRKTLEAIKQVLSAG
jgi:3-deoxy-D-manno-octulosonic-acid transferase